MKKKLILILMIVIICLLLSLLLYQYLLKKTYLDSNKIDGITLTVLQQTSVNKIELNREEIEEFERMFTKYDFKPIFHGNDKGWEILIRITGSPDHTISVLGDFIKFDGIWYATNGSLKEDITNWIQ
ncbi:MAG: hypothetical protein QM644_15795 [Mobilitalea sp.]